MAAGLLALLLTLPPRPARAAAARVEIAPLSGMILNAPAPLSYSAPLRALEMAPGLTASPSLAAPLSAPAAAPAAAAVAAEAFSAPAAVVSPGLPTAASSPGTTHADRASSVAKKMNETAGALQNEAGRSAPDLLARDYSVYRKEDIQNAGDAMMAASDTKDLRQIVYAVFSRNREAQEKLIARYAASKTPGAWSGLAGALYQSLRAAYFNEQDVRAAVSSRLQDSAALFLGRIADDATLPEAARSLARGVIARYLSDDRLLSALAWGRREKDRIADGRRQLAAEVANLPELAKKIKSPNVGTTSENRNWIPPGPEAAAPPQAGTGVWSRTTDLNKRSAQFKDQFARFQLARGRWLAANKMTLSAPAAAREKERWGRANASFAGSLAWHENIVDYTLNHTLRMNFAYLNGGIRGKMLRPPAPEHSPARDARGLCSSGGVRDQDPRPGRDRGIPSLHRELLDPGLPGERSEKASHDSIVHSRSPPGGGLLRRLAAPPRRRDPLGGGASCHLPGPGIPLRRPRPRIRPHPGPSRRIRRQVFPGEDAGHRRAGPHEPDGQPRRPSPVSPHHSDHRGDEVSRPPVRITEEGGFAFFFVFEKITLYLHALFTSGAGCE